MRRHEGLNEAGWRGLRVPHHEGELIVMAGRVFYIVAVSYSALFLFCILLDILYWVFYR